MKSSLTVLLFIISILLFSAIVVSAASDTIPGTLRSYATIHSIGIEWDIAGDDDHDATCQAQYRKQGTGTWKQAMPLFRVDFNGFNGFAGSILFLEPASIYEVLLNLVDPDGGVDNRIETVATRAVPIKPASGRMLHVVPGSGGGAGSVSSPFQGIAAAQAVAQPGDVFLLHAGHYDGFDGNGEIQLNRGGTPANYLVWQAAGDGEVIFDPVRIAADYIWLEGVHIAGNAEIDNEYGLRTYNAPEHVIIIKNRFTDFYCSIALNHGGENWVIKDNTIIGDKDVLGVPDGPPSYGGEGVELEHTNGQRGA